MPGIRAWIWKLFAARRNEQPVEGRQPAGALPEQPIPSQSPDAGLQPIHPETAVHAEPPTGQSIIEQRALLAAEALMENESLMPDLDSTAAQALLDWGIACARQAAASSAELDEAAAEAAMASRMQATRQMMKAINRWVGRVGEANPETDAQTLEKIAAYAALAQGKGLAALNAEGLQEILQEAEQLRQQPEQWIASLRRILEPRQPGEE